MLISADELRKVTAFIWLVIIICQNKRLLRTFDGLRGGGITICDDV